MLRTLPALRIVMCLGVLWLACLHTSAARADAVDPCPPGFQPSHSGCHFGPSEDDFLLCGACACVIVGLGSVSAVLLFLRKGRATGSREG